MSRPRSSSPLSPKQSLSGNWVPDEEAAACFLCHAEFSQIRRKHHCRNCGRVVCDDCSKTRIRVLNYADKQRVCDECHNRNRDDATLAIADEVRINMQITETLKGALKDKVAQVEKFKTFLLSLDDTNTLSAQGDEEFDTLLSLGESAIKELKFEVSQERAKRDHTAKEHKDLQRRFERRQQDSQKLAARVLRAESRLEEVASEEVTKAELQEQLENERKEVEKLRERLRATMLAQNEYAPDGDSLVPLPSPRGVRQTLVAEGRREDEGGRGGRCDPSRCSSSVSSRCVVQ